MKRRWTPPHPRSRKRVSVISLGILDGMTTGFLLWWWIVVAVFLVSVLVLVVFGILRLTNRKDD